MLDINNKKTLNRLRTTIPEHMGAIHNLSLGEIENVVVILSSSRSGSSLLYTILKQLDSIISLPGEPVPYYKLFFSYNSPQIFSDGYEINNNEINYKDLSTCLIGDLCTNKLININDDQQIDLYSRRLLSRFLLEWPTIEIVPDSFIKEVKKTLQNKLSLVDFYLKIITFLRRDHKEINPFFYDIPHEKIREYFKKLPIPKGPPNNSLLIEEPPFILTAPFKTVGADDLKSKTLLIKSTVDQHRPAIFKKLFSKANIRYIHIKRNPAGTINGLMDGWNHHGFFSYNLKPLEVDLQINGYSNEFEWSKQWWNFDLPKNYKDFIQSPLVDVCTNQWYTSQKSILNFFKENRCEVLNIKYEDLVKNFKSRNDLFFKIMKFLNEDLSENTIDLWNIPIIQATNSFSFGRWRKKEKQILNAIKKQTIKNLLEELSYSIEQTQGWT